VEASDVIEDLPATSEESAFRWMGEVERFFLADAAQAALTPMEYHATILVAWERMRYANLPLRDYPTQAALATQTRLKPATVSRCDNRLVRAGFMVLERDAGRDTPRKYRLTSRSSS
jgi:DNA-binding MarR family transcriptional regulator